jgi:hypothetical protein
MTPDRLLKGAFEVELASYVHVHNFRAAFYLIRSADSLPLSSLSSLSLIGSCGLRLAMLPPGTTLPLRLFWIGFVIPNLPCED